MATVMSWMPVVRYAADRSPVGTGSMVWRAPKGVLAALVLVAGHLLSTATVDLVAWLLVILFAVHALLRGRPRWWLGAGVSAGLGTYHKQLVVLLPMPRQLAGPGKVTRYEDGRLPYGYRRRRMRLR